MKYIDFVNHLKSNNIILFDHDYRISYNNINIYYNNYLNNNYLNNNYLNNNYLNNKNNQSGGGNNDTDLKLIVNLSLSSNPQYLLNLAKH
jgi:hypothetical protein